MIIERPLQSHNTIYIKADHAHLTPEQARKDAAEMLRLADEIEQEQEIKEKGAVAIRRGDAVVLDWGKDSLIIPTKRWRELSKQGDCIADKIEAGQKPQGTIRVIACQNCGNGLICPKCDAGYESLAAMARLEELRRKGNGYLRISVYHDGNPCYWEHIQLQGTENLPEVILAIEENTRKQPFNPHEEIIHRHRKTGWAGK